MGMFEFIFGKGDRAKAKRDQWRPSVIGKNLISPVNDYGTCFSCNGAGSINLECRNCHGTGTHSAQCRGCQGTGQFQLLAKFCFACKGIGQNFGKTCQRCGGTGIYKQAVSQDCKKCDGVGKHSITCKKCHETGKFKVTCKKCGGSGWHKFKK